MSRALDFGHLVDLCRRTHEETRRSAARAADTYLVTRNWLFGRYIVEYEDGGADRSTLYGKKLIARLSDELKAGGLKGCSPTNLRKFREFYRAYPEIRQTLSVESIAKLPSEIRQTPSVESPPTAAGIAPDARIPPIGPTPSDQFTSPAPDARPPPIGHTLSDQFTSPLAVLSHPPSRPSPALSTNSRSHTITADVLDAVRTSRKKA